LTSVSITSNRRGLSIFWCFLA